MLNILLAALGEADKLVAHPCDLQHPGDSSPNLGHGSIVLRISKAGEGHPTHLEQLVPWLLAQPLPALVRVSLLLRCASMAIQRSR